jgi:hypothetical protein
VSVLTERDGEEYELRPPGDPVYNVDEPKEAQIVGWRTECFERLGFGPTAAVALAVRRDVDRENVKRLVVEGCSVGLIMEIVL